MNDTDRRIVEDYANYFKMRWDRDGVVNRAATTWASDELMGLVVTDPIKAYELVLAIAEHDGSDEVLDSLANGPLESLLRTRPKEVLGALERNVSSSDRVRQLLSYIWEDNNLPPEVWNRILALSARDEGHAV